MFFKKNNAQQMSSNDALPFSDANDVGLIAPQPNNNIEIRIDEDLLNSAVAKLNQMTGLESVKKDVDGIIKLQRLNIERRSRGLKTAMISNHLIFTGNPGTGKTTVARIMADIYKALNIVEHGQLIETDRSGLVGQYQGQTETKTKQLLCEADGGILFIDEAYSLAVGENDYGQRAIEIILKEMEDNRDNLIVIAAGYTKEMQNFLNSNPGLASRFGKTMHFENYSADEMYVIAQSYAVKNGYIIDNSCFNILREYFSGELLKPNFSNGRLARKLVETCIKVQSLRLSEVGSLSSMSDRDMDMIIYKDCETAIKMVF